MPDFVVIRRAQAGLLPWRDKSPARDTENWTAWE
jgi:hypothetical protein